MSEQKASGANYDRNLVNAETAARQEREGKDFKETPEKEGDIDTTSGYTVDKEGLANNYAVEPEIYAETPGDMQEKNEEVAAERSQELKEVNKTDEDGKLSKDKDERGKGTGVI
ncbi:MAG: hypothetical protein WA865_04540 [Spirulinaceae cyanobacterium]